MISAKSTESRASRCAVRFASPDTAATTKWMAATRKTGQTRPALAIAGEPNVYGETCTWAVPPIVPSANPVITLSEGSTEWPKLSGTVIVTGKTPPTSATP
jgi:hypothetical protein